MRESPLQYRSGLTGLTRVVLRVVLLSVAGLGLAACAADGQAYRTQHHYGHGSGTRLAMNSNRPDVVYRTHRTAPPSAPRAGHVVVPGSYHVVVPGGHYVSPRRDHKGKHMAPRRDYKKHISPHRHTHVRPGAKASRPYARPPHPQARPSHQHARPSHPNVHSSRQHARPSHPNTRPSRQHARPPAGSGHHVRQGSGRSGSHRGPSGR